jgi:hypothetical protein
MDNSDKTDKTTQAATANQPKIVGGTAQQRRSSRVTIAIPVVVYGKGADHNIFVEEVTTSVVNAHGGMFTLSTAVGRLDTVVLKNPRTGVEAKCRMVYVKDSPAGRREAGVEFIDPAPRFWGITFPPPDWDRSARKLPADPHSHAN